MAQMQYPVSPLWRCLCSIRCVAKPYICWQIKSDDSSFWYNYQLGSIPLFLFNPVDVSMDHVSFFWRGIIWDKGKLLLILPTLVIEQILLISIFSDGLDILHWTLSKDEDFSMKTSQEVVREHQIRNGIFFLYLAATYSFQDFFFLMAVVPWFFAHI